MVIQLQTFHLRSFNNYNLKKGFDVFPMLKSEVKIVNLVTMLTEIGGLWSFFRLTFLLITVYLQGRLNQEIITEINEGGEGRAMDEDP